MSVMKSLKIGAALMLLLIACLLAATTGPALLDPVGTKMADDADPFGTPHFVTWREVIIVTAIVAALLWGAFRFLRTQDGRIKLPHKPLKENKE